MDLNLPTDEMTNKYFGEVLEVLCSNFKYSPAAAVELIHMYYRLFTDDAYCNPIGVATQNDDFFWHEGQFDIALRIHYYLTLKRDPAPMSYIKFRQDYQNNRWGQML